MTVTDTDTFYGFTCWYFGDTDLDLLDVDRDVDRVGEFDLLLDTDLEPDSDLGDPLAPARELLFVSGVDLLLSDRGLGGDGEGELTCLARSSSDESSSFFLFFLFFFFSFFLSPFSDLSRSFFFFFSFLRFC